MKYVLEEKNKCVGCGMCAHICPIAAISIVQDEKGFYYPVIDELKCVNCSVCRKKCPQNISIPDSKTAPTSYLVKHKNDSVLNSSTSGGMFTVLCEFIFEKHGVVYGAGYDQEMRILLQRAETINECEKFRGSKYVQCDMHDIFDKIKNDLSGGKWVLFSGTPCMVNAIKNAVDKELCSKLLTLDLICNGVSSPFTWACYVNELQKKHKSRLIDFKFRSKVNGYGSKQEIAVFESGKRQVLTWGTDKYTTMVYYPNRATRPSCSHCRFASMNRVGDFTSGDCSHLVDKYIDFIDTSGASIIFINTEKAKHVFANLKGYIYCQEISFDEAMSIRLKKPIEENPKSKYFIDDVANFGLRNAVRKQVGTFRWYKSIIHREILVLLKRI
jgi:coenzyme F420-reducing hydrogenase beta subunit